MLLLVDEKPKDSFLCSFHDQVVLHPPQDWAVPLLAGLIGQMLKVWIYWLTNGCHKRIYRKEHGEFARRVGFQIA